MTGLDTNIIIRFLTKDDERQFKKSYNLIVNGKDDFLISYPVLVEMIWVLCSRYKFEKDRLIVILEEFVITKGIHFPNLNIVVAAIKAYQNSKADFADCLIGILNKQQKCETTYTFDKKASKLSDFTLLD